MDAETIATLKTVCSAGCATAGFNGDCNDQLEKLVEAGLLVRVNVRKPKGRSNAYQPSDKGKELVRQLGRLGAA
jgi:hypothetical protein